MKSELEVAIEQNDNQQRKDERGLKLCAKDKSSDVLGGTETQTCKNNAGNVTDPCDNYDHKRTNRVREPGKGLNDPGHHHQRSSRTADGSVQRKSGGIDFICIHTQDAGGAGILGSGPNGLSESRSLHKKGEAGPQHHGNEEADDFDLEDGYSVIEQKPSIELGFHRLNIRAEYLVHELLEKDCNAECGKDGNEKILFNDANNDDVIQQPADDE